MLATTVDLQRRSRDIKDTYETLMTQRSDTKIITTVVALQKMFQVEEGENTVPKPMENQYMLLAAHPL
jgi:uncharacterized protein (UPF0335 family)